VVYLVAAAAAGEPLVFLPEEHLVLADAAALAV
jgi:hypothetical protein